MRLLRIYIYSIAAIITSSITAQESTKSFNYFVQTNYAISDGEHTPYWLTARRQGVHSIDRNNGYIRGGGTVCGAFGKGNIFKYRATADIILHENNRSDFFIQQAFAELSWKWLTLSIGSKERFGEGKQNTDYLNRHSFENNTVNILYPNLICNQLSELSSGGLIYSGNSRPVPQIRIEIPEYTPIPGTNEWLHTRAHIAYGFFSDENFQEEHTRNNPIARYGKNILYHSKALFIKIGKPKRFPVTFEGGLELYSQFGGDIYSHGSGHIVSMPNAPIDYLKALIPLSGGDDTPLDEQTNISGNQTGSWHAAFTLHTEPADIRLYGEHMFEDFSQLFFFEYQSNQHGKKKIIYYPWKDIMLGASITNKSDILPFIGTIQYEYLNTYDQSGALYHDPSVNFDEQMDGVDNYYNHGIYPGWHHWGFGMGNPLVISPIYNSTGALHFRSNRIKAHNMGINGIISEQLPIAYRMQYTYSENWGTYLNPLEKKAYSTSLLAEFAYAPPRSKWLGTLSIGYDRSNMIGNNFGAMLTITRAASINF